MRRHRSRLSRVGLLIGLLVLILAPLGASTHHAVARSAASHGALVALTSPRLNAVPGDGTLIRDQSNGRVYLIWSGARHWIVNEATLQLLGFNDANPVNEPHSFVATLPYAGTLSTRVVDNVLFPISPVKAGSPELRLPNPSTAPGTSFAVHGDGFGANESILVTIAGVTVPATANSTGSFDATAAVPALVPPGSMLDVVALGVVTRDFEVEPLWVIPPAPPATVVAQSASVAQGQTLVLNGTGFAANEPIDVFLAQGAAIKKTFADGNGNFIGLAMHVPSTLSAGAHTLMAFGLTSKRLANGTIEITAPVAIVAHITLDRAAAYAGSLVRIKGDGFADNEAVRITFGASLALIVTASRMGQFSFVGFTVPASAPPGAVTISAAGQTSGRIGAAALTIVALNPTLSLVPGVTAPGTVIAVTGQGFGPDEIITLALNGQALSTHPGVIRTTSNGAFAVTFSVPETALAGTNTLAATGATSRGSATASLTVSLPVQSTWYFAGGNTSAGYSTQIALVNPGNAPAAVTFSFMFTSGSPIPYSTTVPANSRTTIDVGSMVGPGRDVFTMLTADRKIGASETVFRNGQDFSSTIGASAPLRTWYLAEGYTGISFHEYIRIFNPGNLVARAEVRLLPFNGRAAASVAQLINPQSGTIVDVNSIEAGLSLSAIVSSDQPVVVERLITFGPGGYGATEQVGSNTPSSTWLFAEGSTVNNFETYVTILNPSSSQPAAVTATFFDQAGNVLGNDTIVIDPLRRGNIKVNDFVRSSGIATILTANIPVVAERPLYFGSPNSATAAAGGSDVFGRNGGGVTWLFPEGNTSQNFTEFLLLQNPSAQAAPVTVHFYQTNGQAADYNVVLPPKSRATVDVLRDVPALPPGLHSALVRSTSGVPIIAEQSIYSDNFTKGDGEAGIAQ
jgi:Family of unknown function (DUF5719)